MEKYKILLRQIINGLIKLRSIFQSIIKIVDITITWCESVDGMLSETV